ncbi:NACHT domain-containing protein [Providencia rettgeri]
MIEAFIVDKVMEKLVDVAINKVFNKPLIGEADECRSVVVQFYSKTFKNNYINKHVNKVKLVRTILHDNDVDLDTVYYPLKIYKGSENKKTNIFVQIKDEQLPKYSGILNFIGIAGQGKSTLLKKIFLLELKFAKKIPLYIELKKLYENNVKKTIKKELESLGLYFIDDQQFIIFLNQGFLLLLLDGFDEIPPNNRGLILNEIIDINKSNDCPIITSSRPNTELCNHTGINNWRVRDLDKNDCLEIVKKLVSNEKIKEDISSAINKNLSLSETLVSPILITLLIKCFPYYDEIPKNTFDFYHKLYEILYTKHDEKKAFNRFKYSIIKDVVRSKKFFSALSFYSFFSGKYFFSEQEMHDELEDVFIMNNLDPSEVSNFLKDIRIITCLIQENGIDEYVYIHRSVQEYHAAYYFKYLPDEMIDEFIHELLNLVRESEQYDNTLYFLNKISPDFFDKKVASKFFRQIQMHLFLHQENYTENYIKTKCQGKTIKYNRVIFVDSALEELNVSSKLNFDDILDLNILNVITYIQRRTDHGFNDMSNYKLEFTQISEHIIDLKVDSIEYSIAQTMSGARNEKENYKKDNEFKKIINLLDGKLKLPLNEFTKMEMLKNKQLIISCEVDLYPVLYLSNILDDLVVYMKKKFEKEFLPKYLSINSEEKQQEERLSNIIHKMKRRNN